MSARAAAALLRRVHPTAAPRPSSFTPIVPVAHWRPEVKSVIPVVRRAVLVKHTPHLSSHHPPEIFAAVRAAWGAWQETYRAAVARFAGLRPEDLEIFESESVRLKWDGKTPMLDLPRIRTRLRAGWQFDLRNCVALCTDELSSKVWTRVGLPRRGGAAGCSTQALRGAVSKLRALSSTCDEWFFEEFFRLVEAPLAGLERRRTGTLEVTTVGLQVDDAVNDDAFDEWLLDVKQKGPNLDNTDLRAYLGDAADLDFPAQDLRVREPDTFWMSIPSAVRLSSGDLAARRFLFLVRGKDDVAQLVGIGLDDSEEGDLAAEAALKISRVVANRA